MPFTGQKEFSTKNFFSKCVQIRSFLRIWSHLLKKSLMENFIFCAVIVLFEPFFDSNNIKTYPNKTAKNSIIHWRCWLFSNTPSLKILKQGKRYGITDFKAIGFTDSIYIKFRATKCFWKISIEDVLICLASTYKLGMDRIRTFFCHSL